MGENHIKISSLFLDVEPIFNSFNKDGYVTTFSKNLFIPTDSAAAATALATGKKVNNKEIAYHKGEYIDSISDYAKSQGYGVGIVTTDSLAGATPAAFSSNASNRSNTDEIINSHEVNTKNSQDKWRAESLILRHFHSSLLKDSFVTVRIVLRRFT